MRIGIFGGAFDPVHKEHKKIIQRSRLELNLDKVIVLLSYTPPHKDCKISPFHDRLKMLDAELSSLDYVIIDKREYLNQKEPNFAFQVLKTLVSDYPDDDLIYIIGGDSMIKFHTWAHPDIISQLMPIAVISRKGYKGLDQAIQNARKEYSAEIRLLTFEGEDISSSLIKAEYELERYSGLVSAEVHKIIVEAGLYSDFKDIVARLMSNISKELFEHSKSTVYFAMRFANQLDLRYEQVFLSALLHDCAKEMQIPKEYEDIPIKITHQYLGAEVACKEYGVNDQEVLSAIRYHTTGKAKMGTLDKLIYLADMLEPLRDFPGVERLREIVEEDFEKGFLECVKQSIKRLEKSGRDIYYLTMECYDYYNNKAFLDDCKNKKEKTCHLKS